MRSTSANSLVVAAALLATLGCSRPAVLTPPPPSADGPQLFLQANAYRAGAGVPRDPARALGLYRKAGALGYAPALQTLALAYRYGELGLAPDEDEARRCSMEAEDALHHQPPIAHK
jgi:TPR repeat protein